MQTNQPATGREAAGPLPAPEYLPVKENEQVLLSLGITADQIAALPIIVQTGGNYLVQEVRNPEALQALRPAAETMQLLATQYRLAAFCVFCRNGVTKGDAVVRCLTPLPDDPKPDQVAAACALACYLYDIAMVKREELTIVFWTSSTGAGSAAPEPIVVHLVTREGKITTIEPHPAEPTR